MTEKIPRILVNSLADGTWKLVSPDALRRCLGEDLDDLKLFEDLDTMLLMSAILDNAGFVDDPAFCMTRERNLAADDLRLEFPRALFIAGSIVPGDDVFVAIQRTDSEEYDPPVLVLDYRKAVPARWTKRGKLSEFIRAICSEGTSETPF